MLLTHSASNCSVLKRFIKYYLLSLFLFYRKWFSQLCSGGKACTVIFVNWWVESQRSYGYENTPRGRTADNCPLEGTSTSAEMSTYGAHVHVSLAEGGACEQCLLPNNAGVLAQGFEPAAPSSARERAINWATKAVQLYSFILRKQKWYCWRILIFLFFHFPQNG